MPSSHSPADDIVYDLVSIQYHALQAAELYSKYIEDAHEHEDVAAFIRQCQEQDSERRPWTRHEGSGLTNTQVLFAAVARGASADGCVCELPMAEVGTAAARSQRRAVGAWGRPPALPWAAGWRSLPRDGLGPKIPS